MEYSIQEARAQAEARSAEAARGAAHGGRLRSVREVARAAGTTSRTLRHYGSVGLVAPSRVGANGYRYYDDRALVRLQRVLLLRELGLGLEAIGQVLDAQDARAASGVPGGDAAAAEAAILEAHLDLLRAERERVGAQIGSVERTIAALRRGSPPGSDQEEDLMSENMFEGFDHTRYREEVEQRWGADAYRRSDRWWRGMTDAERADWQGRTSRLAADWAAAAERGADPESPEARELARRHVEWLNGVPGTPAHEAGGDAAAYVLGLAEMYVADERFAANYGGLAGARFVRDALTAYVRGAD